MFLGLDLSLTSSGVYMHTPDAKDYKNFTKDKKFVIETKEKRGVVRLKYIAAVLSDFLEEHGKPTLIAIEGYAMGVRGGRSFDIGELGGVIRTLLYDRQIPFIVAPPTVLKKFLTGKGVADKSIILKEVFRQYGFDTPKHDIADAFVLSQIAKDYYRGLIAANKQDIKPVYRKEALKGCSIGFMPVAKSRLIK